MSFTLCPRLTIHDQTRPTRNEIIILTKNSDLLRIIFILCWVQFIVTLRGNMVTKEPPYGQSKKIRVHLRFIHYKWTCACNKVLLLILL